MTEARPTIGEEIARYLRTGEADPHCVAWSGGGFVERDLSSLVEQAYEDAERFARKL